MRHLGVARMGAGTIDKDEGALGLQRRQCVRKAGFLFGLRGLLAV